VLPQLYFVVVVDSFSFVDINFFENQAILPLNVENVYGKGELTNLFQTKFNVNNKIVLELPNNLIKF